MAAATKARMPKQTPKFDAKENVAFFFFFDKHRIHRFDNTKFILRMALAETHAKSILAPG